MIIVDDGSSDETESVVLSIIQNDNHIQFHKLIKILGLQWLEIQELKKHLEII
jgi:glycosyltransferase involved in cell wall biosynthesis